MKNSYIDIRVDQSTGANQKYAEKHWGIRPRNSMFLASYNVWNYEKGALNSRKREKGGEHVWKNRKYSYRS